MLCVDQLVQVGFSFDVLVSGLMDKETHAMALTNEPIREQNVIMLQGICQPASKEDGE